MPDISMCATTACPRRSLCYRYRAIPSGGRQTYGAFLPDTSKKPCAAFWQVRLGDSLLPTLQVDRRNNDALDDS